MYKYKKPYLVGIIILLLAITGCSNGGTSDSDENSASSNAVYHKISAEEAKTQMAENKDVIILDVRTEAEYNEGHIENAVLLPLNEIQAGNFEGLDDKGATILVYCRSGNRSKQASALLVDAGYTGIYDFGGILDWPYEIVTD